MTRMEKGSGEEKDEGEKKLGVKKENEKKGGIETNNEARS